MRPKIIIAAVMLAFPLAACASRTDNTVAGAVAGGATGAAVAGPVGAVVGAGAGALAGNQVKPTRRYVRRPVFR